MSLGIYVHDREPTAMVDALIAQAVEADGSGFDGVTLSEHHAGHRCTCPARCCARVGRPSRDADGLVGTVPTAPVVARPVLVAEELAWLHVRHPGRVTAGFASGYVEKDFLVCRVRFDDRNSRFRESRSTWSVASCSTPSAAFAEDPVVNAVAGSIPLVAAAKGPLAVESAANGGLSRHRGSAPRPGRRPAAVHAKYLEAGGIGPWIRIPWAWGLWADLPNGAEAPGEGRAEHRSMSRLTTIRRRSPSSSSPTWEASNSTCLSLAIHRPGIDPDVVTEQIRLIGSARSCHGCAGPARPDESSRPVVPGQDCRDHRPTSRPRAARRADVAAAASPVKNAW